MRLIIMEELINLVSNVGFPIAITAYLMMRFENKLEKLDDSINSLVIAINNSNINKGLQ
jgi:hypothetical protein